MIVIHVDSGLVLETALACCALGAAVVAPSPSPAVAAPDADARFDFHFPHRVVHSVVVCDVSVDFHFVTGELTYSYDHCLKLLVVLEMIQQFC